MTTSAAPRFELMQAAGHQAVTVDRICQVAGVPVRTFNYFATVMAVPALASCSTACWSRARRSSAT